MSKPQRPAKPVAPSKDDRVSDYIQKDWIGRDTDHKDWAADDDGGTDTVFKWVVPKEGATKHSDHKGDIGGGSDATGVDALTYEVKLTNAIKGEPFEEIAFAKYDGIDGAADGRSTRLDFPSLEADADDEFIDINIPSLEAEADDEFVDSHGKGGDDLASRGDLTQIKFDGIDGESRVPAVDPIEDIVGIELIDLPDAATAKATFAGGGQPESQMVFTNDTIDKATSDDQTESQIFTNDTIDAETMDLTYQTIESVVVEPIDIGTDFAESSSGDFTSDIGGDSDGAFIDDDGMDFDG